MNYKTHTRLCRVELGIIINKPIIFYSVNYLDINSVSKFIMTVR